MRYISPLGTPCAYEDAHVGGSLRQGYRAELSRGDHIGFDMAFVDTKPAAGTMTFTDSTSHQARAELLARAAAASSAGKLVRDAVMGRGSVPAQAKAEPQTVHLDGQAIRDLIRRNRNT